MSVRMRHTSGHTANRRSHHALTEPRMSKCANCGAMHLRHRLCTNCGNYRGKIVVDMVKARTDRQEKRNSKLKAMGEEIKKEEESPKTSTDLKALSKKDK